MQSYSQYRQDLIVDDLLREQCTGFFLDIGAHDGVCFSNSLFFEKHRGWDGICVEPNPTVFERLRQNRSCTAVHGCISDRPGQVRFAKVSGHAEMLSGIAADYDPRHLKRIEREVKEHSGDIEYIDVPSFSVNELLARRQIDTVDFVSIDTEGGELKILEGIDFARFHFRVIAVENNYRSKEFRRLLAAAGFELMCRASCDEIYANAKDLTAGRIKRPERPYFLRRLFGRKKSTSTIRS